MNVNPLDVYVLYATDAEQKFIKVAEDGCLAIFEDEASAKRAKRRNPGTDYKQVNYYSQEQVGQMQADSEALRARVAELKHLCERLQHCAQGFYVDQGDYGHMEAIMQDYHAIMRGDATHPTDPGKGGEV